MTKRKADVCCQPSEPISTMVPLGKDFFNKPCVQLAKALLGAKLVRVIDVDGYRTQLVAKIVETEAYLGGDDRASHSYNGKRTDRNRAMFMAPGTAYVYPIYGMYECLNISSASEGAAVLIRALQPIEGLQQMNVFRQSRGSKKATGPAKLSLNKLKTKDLCSGPSKLCIAMKISKKEFNQVDLSTNSSLFVSRSDCDISDQDISVKPRIGLGKFAGEWAEKPLRFYITANECVSVK